MLVILWAWVITSIGLLLGQGYPMGGEMGNPRNRPALLAEHTALCREAQTNGATAYRVAQRYYKGKIVNPSPALGLHYLTKSATLGYPWGMHEYGVALYWGLGLKADREQAKVWLKKAQEAGKVTNPVLVKDIMEEVERPGRPFSPVERSSAFNRYAKD